MRGISYSNGCCLLTLVLLATVLDLVHLNLHPEVPTPGPAMCHPHSINKDHMRWEEEVVTRQAHSAESWMLLQALCQEPKLT